MRRLMLLPLLFALALGAEAARAAEVIPPAPAAYFNDYAGVVGRGTAQALNGALDQFERETSNQLVVAIFPHLQSDSSIEDYTVRVAQAWHAGQKGKDNGAVLFIFSQDHKAYIQVGYGLEPTLTDATCKRIIEDELIPHLRRNDYDGGLRAAVAAMIAATRGEYQGNGQTVHDRRNSGSDFGGAAQIFIIFAVVILLSILRSRQQVVYRGGGRRTLWGGGGPWIFPGGGGGGGFGGGGFGGGGGGGGGGFSGGGGSFGGGGAGGSW